jgi:hypothetical protein
MGAEGREGIYVPDVDISAQIYRRSFRENKPKTLVQNWAYKFGHWEWYLQVI